MLSISIPKNIIISSTNNFSRIKNSNNFQIKKRNINAFSLIKTGEGIRIIVKNNKNIDTTIISSIYKLIKGFSIGWQKHLRLVGVGFRATIRDTSFQKEYINSKFIIQNYLQKRILYLDTTYPNQKNQFLKLKIGFSHEAIHPRIITNNKYIKVSSLEGRSKGRLICIKSDDKYELNQILREVRSFRFPETYKHKGIYFNKELVKLKKGKRQN